MLPFCIRHQKMITVLFVLPVDHAHCTPQTLCFNSCYHSKSTINKNMRKITLSPFSPYSVAFVGSYPYNIKIPQVNALNVWMKFHFWWTIFSHLFLPSDLFYSFIHSLYLSLFALSLFCFRELYAIYICANV